VIENFFELPRSILLAVKKTPKYEEPYIEYTKSIWMTQDDYVKSSEQIAKRKENTAKEKEKRKLEVQSNKLKRVAKQRQKDQNKLEKEDLRTSKKQHRDAWSTKVVAKYGEKLHTFIKSNTALPSWRAPYCGSTPPICRKNQKQALAS